jgi:hypothetical protein
MCVAIFMKAEVQRGYGGGMMCRGVRIWRRGWSIGSILALGWGIENNLFWI